MDRNVITEGWGWPSNSKKAHYFLKNLRSVMGAQSLCYKWGFFGKLEIGNDESFDNCAECKRRLAKRKLRLEKGS